MHAASRFKAHLTHPLIFKSYPSLEDVNHLKAHLMMVPGGLSMGARFGLDHMRNRCASSCLPDTQVLIEEKGPQPVGLKGPIACVHHAELHPLLSHLEPLLDRGQLRFDRGRPLFDHGPPRADPAP